MGYIAVKGGTESIEESIKRLSYERLHQGKILKIDDIQCGMRELIDQVMSEASLYSEKLAAIAIKQGEGSPEEAVFLLRAYRSTLPRKHYTRTTETSSMFVERRISASHKDLPGGQILGASRDYTHRLLDFDLIDESLEKTREWVRAYDASMDIEDQAQDKEQSGVEKDLSQGKNLQNIVDILRQQGYSKDFEEDEREPLDITKKGLNFPAGRSERLQILTRGQTGAVVSLGYAALRGYGASHPTVGELRVGQLPLYIENPMKEEKPEEDYYLGEIKVTEVESFFPISTDQGKGRKRMELDVGYGLCYGQNETKAIAMSILDQCLKNPDHRYPTHDEEFVLMHIDSVESSGFMSHLKLPHYVTFQSKVYGMKKKNGRGDKKDD